MSAKSVASKEARHEAPYTTVCVVDARTPPLHREASGHVVR